MSIKYNNNLSAVLGVLGRNQKKALDYAGAFIAAEAFKQCPKDTGYLASTIFYKVEGDKVRIGATAPYTIFVHEGTYKMLPRRFLFNAVYSNIHMLKSVIVQGMKGG